jgi:hypothetical protein
MITLVLSIGWISCAVMLSPEAVIGPEASSVTSDTGSGLSHRQGLGRSPRPSGVFADRPSHLHGGWLILKCAVDLEVRPCGFKIMICYTLGTQGVRNVQRCERLRD